MAYNGAMRLLTVALLALLSSGCIMEQFSPIPFEWVDTNQDTYIVFEEYYAFLSRMETTPPIDPYMTWYMADQNGDGVVTLYEPWSNLFPANVIYRQRGY